MDEKKTLDVIQVVQSVCKDVDTVRHEVKMDCSFDGQDKIKDDDADKNLFFNVTDRSESDSVSKNPSKSDEDKSKVKIDTSVRKVNEVIDEKSLPCDSVKSNLEPTIQEPALYESFSKWRKHEYCSKHTKSRYTKNPAMKFSLTTSNMFESLSIKNEIDEDEDGPVEEVGGGYNNRDRREEEENA